MIDQELDGQVPDTVAPGTTVTTARRGWWRSAGRRPTPADGRDGKTPAAPRSTGIVELRDVAPKTPSSSAAGEARTSQIAGDASAAPGSAGSAASADVAAGAPGGEVVVVPRRRLRWVGWIRRRVIHEPPAL